MKISTTNKPEKKLTEILKKHSGRDAFGRISVRHQGNRHKRLYRIIDFKRNKQNIEATVLKIEYDPNRNADIALVEYKDKERRYILHPKDLNIGDKIIAGNTAEFKPGNAMPLKNIPLGAQIHNVELYSGKGGQIIRGAGAYGVVNAKEGKYVHIKMPSGEIRKFLGNCFATLGQIGNIKHKYEVIGSAGRKRRMGIRPTVRGTAQNPRSHPHGGGEGRSGEGMHPKTPWGKKAKGKRTRNKKKWSSSLIIKRRKK